MTKYIKKILILSTMVTVVLLVTLAFPVLAQDTPPSNIDELVGVTQSATYSVTDTGWSETYNQTNDCVNGWGNDDWELTNTTYGYLTVTARDDFLIGDYFEIWVDSVLIGTTPDPGCLGSTHSVGSFTVLLAPGVHTIEIRDAAFGACTYCPAGFYITGEWEPTYIGGEAYPVSKTGILAPWIAIALVIAAGGFYLIRRRVHS
ncbi:hypothetical protein ACFLTV_02285 [Chloroflexota bacterium]